MDDLIAKEDFLVSHFRQGWSCQPGLQEMDNLMISPMILNDQNIELIKSISVEEIEEVIRCMNLEKALGLDGFLAFFQHFWYCIKWDIMATVQYFFNHSMIPNS